jgi:glycerol-1-phosphate dehydrogenase [NAD(P)+]
MPDFVYGSVDGVGESIGRYAVFTMEVPWDLVKNRIGGTPCSITFVKSLDREYLDRLVRELPIVDIVIGVGGGVAVDCAKYFAWKRERPLVLVPTIVSVDAYVTQEIAVRDHGVVKYTGHVIPSKIVIDYKAIRSAPRQMNTAGAGDVYSGRTALFDWKLSHEKTGEPYDERVAEGMTRVLDNLVANSSEIKNVTEQGIRTLVELHAETNRLVNAAPRLPNKPPSRPEEGSEHAFFYTLENVTKRSFVHGQAVGTGIFISTHYQTSDEDEVAHVMDNLGLVFRPNEYGVSHDDFIMTVLNIKSYSRNAGLLYSILDEVQVSRQDAEELWIKLHV